MTACHSPLFTLESGQSGLRIYTSGRDAAEADTVRQIQVRNEWGRYITFTGISTHAYKGTNGYTIPGTPPRTTCFGTYTRQCTTTPGRPARFVPGQPGGTERKSFTTGLHSRLIHMTLVNGM